MEEHEHTYDILPAFEPVIKLQIDALKARLDVLEKRRDAAEYHIEKIDADAQASRDAALDFIEKVDDEICEAMDNTMDSFGFLERISDALRGRPQKPW
jgi:hypothetical protein